MLAACGCCDAPWVAGVKAAYNRTQQPKPIHKTDGVSSTEFKAAVCVDIHQTTTNGGERITTTTCYHEGVHKWRTNKITTSNISKVKINNNWAHYSTGNPINA